MKLWYLLVCLYCVNSLNAEELYRWVDEDGNVQYTQTPPPAGVNAEVKSVKGAETASATGRPQPKTEEKTDQNPVGEGEADKIMAEKTANCQKAMQDLQVLESKSEVVTLDVNDPNKAVPMDENTRKQRIATEKAYIKAYCDGVKESAPSPAKTEEVTAPPAQKPAQTKK